MVWKSKKIFLVLLSVVFGALIIVSAGNVAGIFEVSSSEKNDSKWIDTLSVLPDERILTSTQKGDFTLDKNLSNSATTTDMIAQGLINEYVAYQTMSATSTLNDNDAKNIANLLAQKITLPQRNEYALRDINVSTNNTRDAYISYVKAVSSMVAKHTASEQVENELTIFIKALNTNSATELAKLQTKVSLYQDLIKNLLSLRVPSSVAPLHLQLIQSYETLRVATIGLQSMLRDPAIGTAALAEYRNGTETLALVAKDFGDFFTKNTGQ